MGEPDVIGGLDVKVCETLCGCAEEQSSGRAIPAEKIGFEKKKHSK